MISKKTSRSSSPHPFARRLCSVRDASEILGISEISIRRGIKVGSIPHARIGGRVLVDLFKVFDRIDRADSRLTRKDLDAQKIYLEKKASKLVATPTI